MLGKLCLALATAVVLTAAGGANPAMAGSQCFKNLDKKSLYITVRYRDGRVVHLYLKSGEKVRFDNVRKGDAYCYSFQKIGNDCPNRNPVHLTSCQNPKLM
jgi:hypothetical protein